MFCNHVVIIVPGIRDRGGNWNQTKSEIEAAGLSCIVISWDEYYDIPRFLVPAPWFRRTAMRKLEERIEGAIRNNTRDNALPQISFIAHSFGSYILCYLLRRTFKFQVSNLIICGSVLPKSFDFTKMSCSIKRVVNDVGNIDNWPLIASCVTFGYGTIGTYGYFNPGVIDRFHPNVGHGAFTDPGFATDWWVPVLKSELIVEPRPNIPRIESSLKRSLVAIAQKIKWLVLLVVGFFLTKELEISECLFLKCKKPEVTAYLEREVDMSQTGCRDGRRWYQFEYKDKFSFSERIETYDYAGIYVPASAKVEITAPDGNDIVSSIVSDAGPKEGSGEAYSKKFEVNGLDLRINSKVSDFTSSDDNDWGLNFVSSLPLSGVRITVTLPKDVRILGIDMKKASHWEKIKDKCIFLYEDKYTKKPVLKCEEPLRNTPNRAILIPWIWNAFDSC